MSLSAQHLIVGAGATGWSVARYLQRQQLTFRVVDSRRNPPHEKQFRAALDEKAIHFGSFDTHWFEECSVLVLSPGVSSQIEPIQRALSCGAEVISDIELFVRACSRKYIAITGSNGKSTVTAMVEKVLLDCDHPAKAGGNYGIPALDLLSEEDNEYYVLELSSFQLETTHSLRAKVAVLLNVTDDHLDRHQSYERYRGIKKSIFKGAEYCVVNRDQSDLLPVNCEQELKTFGLHEPDVQQFGTRVETNDIWLVKGEQKIMPSKQLKVAGEHNVQNALATLALADCLQLDLQKAANSLSEFTGLPFRCELVADADGVRWFNDSKGTNLGATQAAIGGLPKGQILICGGVFKGGALEQFKQVASENVDHIIAFGKDRNVFMALFDGTVTIDAVDDLTAAVVRANQVARSGQSVLFSPACASFDMFENYIHRGNEFNRLVQEVVTTARAS